MLLYKFPVFPGEETLPETLTFQWALLSVSPAVHSFGLSSPSWLSFFFKKKQTTKSYPPAVPLSPWGKPDHKLCSPGISRFGGWITPVPVSVQMGGGKSHHPNQCPSQADGEGIHSHHRRLVLQLSIPVVLSPFPTYCTPCSTAFSPFLSYSLKTQQPVDKDLTFFCSQTVFVI